MLIRWREGLAALSRITSRADRDLVEVRVSGPGMLDRNSVGEPPQAEGAARGTPRLFELSRGGLRVRNLQVSFPTLFACVGLLILGSPTILSIGRQSWTDEQAQQGPLVLAIGGWLLWRSWPAMRAVGTRGSLALTVVALALCSIAYGGGRLAALYVLEGYALYVFGITAIYALVGLPGLRQGFFSCLFLAFAAPVPFAVGWPVTVALRLWISELTVRLLRIFDVQAAREGLTLYISSYRIEMEQACSGMNSLLALSALGLCYVHLRRNPPLRYFLALLPLVILFAVVANFVRVISLAVATLWFGDAVAQGLMHQAMGFATFTVALVLTFAADEVFWRLKIPWVRAEQGE